MIEDTGERVIPDKMKITNELLIEHLARYHFARQYVEGRILDIACGSGYGSHILAKGGKAFVNEIIGVDKDPDIIRYARATYYHPLTTFLEKDVTDPELPEQLGKFDLIISFETIEHLKDDQIFLTNLYNMLKPDGTLILSTPFGEGRGKPSGVDFHVHQLTEAEFRELFVDYREVEFFYQKGALITPAGYKSEIEFPLGIAVCRK